MIHTAAQTDSLKYGFESYCCSEKLSILPIILYAQEGFKAILIEGTPTTREKLLKLKVEG